MRLTRLAKASVPGSKSTGWRGTATSALSTDGAGGRCAFFLRLNRQTDYGVLNRLARHRVKTNLIVNNWDDLLLIVGSLKFGMVSASELMRVLHR